MGKGNPHRPGAKAGRSGAAARHGVVQGRTKTRRSQPLLADDPATYERDLSAQLRALGLYAANTVGDGNCLFRALSDQLTGGEGEHGRLRKEVCDHLESQPERYSAFVEDDRPFEEHVRVMRIPGTYAGHLELSAFAHVFQRPIKVIQPGLVYVVGCEDESPSAKLKGKGRARDEEEERLRKSPLYVAYHNWEHYSSVRNLGGPHKGVPGVVEIRSRTSPDPSGSSPPPPAETDPSPSPTEKLVLSSLPCPVPLSRIRALLDEHSNEWEHVVELLLSELEAHTSPNLPTTNPNSNANSPSGSPPKGTEPFFRAGPYRDPASPAPSSSTETVASTHSHSSAAASPSPKRDADSDSEGSAASAPKRRKGVDTPPAHAHLPPLSSASAAASDTPEKAAENERVEGKKEGKEKVVIRLKPRERRARRAEERTRKDREKGREPRVTRGMAAKEGITIPSDGGGLGGLKELRI